MCFTNALMCFTNALRSTTIYKNKEHNQVACTLKRQRAGEEEEGKKTKVA